MYPKFSSYRNKKNYLNKYKLHKCITDTNNFMINGINGTKPTTFTHLLDSLKSRNEFGKKVEAKMTMCNAFWVTEDILGMKMCFSNPVKFVIGTGRKDTFTS